jgi:hypothetical protein
MRFNILLLPVFAGLALADSCSLDSNFPAEYQDLVIPLTQVATDASGVAVEGAIQIVDKCTFKVVNFTLAGSNIPAMKL